MIQKEQATTRVVGLAPAGGSLVSETGHRSRLKWRLNYVIKIEFMFLINTIKVRAREKPELVSVRRQLLRAQSDSTGLYSCASVVS